jgi:hypothetical protein
MRIESLLVVILFAVLPVAAEQQEDTKVAPVAPSPAEPAIVYRGANTVTELRGFALWPPLAPHYEVWPFFLQTGYRIPLKPAINQVRIAEGKPSLLAQGFSPDANWELVRLRTHDGENDLRLKKKSLWGSDFFQDDVFRKDDLQALRLAGSGAGTFSITPAAALQPGQYLLCTEAVEQTMMRVCFPFEISARGI